MDSTKALLVNLRAAFDSNDVAIKNVMLRKAYDDIAALGRVQPVAWRYQFRTGDAWTLTNHKPSDRAIPPATGKIEPLYATPPAPQPALTLIESRTATKFWGGFFGMLALFVFGAVIFALTAWLMFVIGPLWGGIVFAVMLALFAGFMNATTPDKEHP